MSVNTGEILPIVTSNSWVQPDQGRKETQAIPAVGKVEGGTTSKIGEGKEKREQQQGSPLYSREHQFHEHVVEKVQEFLDEATNVQLKFTVESGFGEATVQVLDKESGEVIRQIPPESLRDVEGKLDELRGLLFDDKV